MIQAFLAYAFVSGVAGLLALLLWACRPLTRRCFSAAWHYYAWLIVLVVFLVPLRISLPAPVAEAPPAVEVVASGEPTAAALPELPPQTEAEVPPQATKETAEQSPMLLLQLQKLWRVALPYIAEAWLWIALGLLLLRVAGYLAFLQKVRFESEAVACPQLGQYTKRRVQVRISERLASPLLVGVFRPMLLLPKAELEENQLACVLSHEMTHLKRQDILYKWLVTFVKCLHWFNPLVYILAKQISIDCELSCDAAAVKDLDAEQRGEYMQTILALLIHGSRRQIPLTTAMTGNKETIKRRFMMIKNARKVGKKIRILSAVLAVVLLCGALLASGVLATAILNEHEDITFVCNGEKIRFVNAPFYENNTVYLPLRELFEKVGVFDDAENSLLWDNFKIYITLNGEKKTHYAIEIGSNGLGISHNEPFSEDKAINMFLVTTEAPVLLKGTTTYVPYDFIDYMLNRGMVNLAKDGPYDIACVVNGENPIAYITPALQWPIDGEVVSRDYDGDAHKGIDIVGVEGTLIHSAVRGTVTEVGFNNEMGNFISIASSSGIEVLYGHLKDVLVSEGMQVEQRTQIGSVGKTGMATGAFLHFEIKVNGKYYDPMLFWKRSSKGTLNATYSVTESPKGVQVDVIEVDRWMNAENLSYADMLSLQKQVDEGLVPRRTIPEAVIRRFAGTIFGEDAQNGEIIALTGDDINCSATFLLNGQTYSFELYKPIKRGDNGIWVVKHFQQMDAAVIREVFLYERTPGLRRCMQGADGVYQVTQYTSAFLDYAGKEASEITAYFVPNGDITKRSVVGNVKAPFEYQTMAKVGGVDVTLEKGSEGQLWFELTFPDGNKCASGVYNVICIEE